MVDSSEMSSANTFTAAYERNDEFWAQYVKGRPKIPQSYFKTIFDYHGKRNDNFSVAHDVGAGAGVHSAKLLDKFDRVILSDAYEDNMKAARTQLQAHAERCQFMTAKLEDTIDTLPPRSVDLVFAQAMFHHTRQEQALAAVVHQLRPGGTLAISMVGIPVFKDPRIWDIWTRMTKDLVADGIGKTGGPYGPTRLTLRSQIANLDSIPLSDLHFLPGALRLKMRDPLGPGRDFVRETLLGEELKDHYPPWSEIGKDDVVSYVDDDEGWTFQADYEGLRNIILTYPYNHESQIQKDLWLEMKRAIGDGETEGVWPYSLILATRAEDSVEQ